MRLLDKVKVKEKEVVRQAESKEGNEPLEEVQVLVVQQQYVQSIIS